MNENQGPPPTQKQPAGLAIGSILSLLSLLGFALFVYFNFKTIEVTGDSMLPTFQTKQRLLATSAYWLVGPIKTNDIIVVEDAEKGTVIKRVHALGGDRVDWLNIPEDYALGSGPYKVPSNHVYILGDNREVSEDSRKFGPIPEDRIVGKIVLKRWF